MEWNNKFKPNVVLNCAGYTDVEKSEIDFDNAKKINGDALIYLSKACNTINAKLIHISSDYVFNGEKNTPYEVDDERCAINKYGQSKLLGEENVERECNDYLIVRTQWLFGFNGNNFVKKMLQLAETQHEVSVVNDQFGSPTYTYDLAIALLKAVKLDLKGIIHITNSGTTSWYGFTQDIYDICNINTKVIGVDSEHYKTNAKRPKNSILSCAEFRDKTGAELRNYKEALNCYIREINTKG